MENKKKNDVEERRKMTRSIVFIMASVPRQRVVVIKRTYAQSWGIREEEKKRAISIRDHVYNTIGFFPTI